MNSEYQDHYDWMKKGVYTRDGKNLGIYYSQPVNYTQPQESWKPKIYNQEDENVIYERMMKEFGGYKFTRIKKTDQCENPYVTSYQNYFRPELNFRPPFSTYEKAAQLYASEVDRDEFEEKVDIEESEETENLQEIQQTHNTQEAEKPGPIELTNKAMAMIKKDIKAKGKIWHLSNLPVVDPKERYQRYRSFLDKKTTIKNF